MTHLEQNSVRLADAVFSALSRPAYQREAEYIREDIAGLEEDVRGWEMDLAEIDREIPRMERERLEKQRDVAIAKLHIMELRQQLAQKGGAQ